MVPIRVFSLLLRYLSLNSLLSILKGNVHNAFTAPLKNPTAAPGSPRRQNPITLSAIARPVTSVPPSINSSKYSLFFLSVAAPLPSAQNL